MPSTLEADKMVGRGEQFKNGVFRTDMWFAYPGESSLPNLCIVGLACLFVTRDNVR